MIKRAQNGYTLRGLATAGKTIVYDSKIGRAQKDRFWIDPHLFFKGVDG